MRAPTGYAPAGGGAAPARPRPPARARRTIGAVWQTGQRRAGKGPGSRRGRFSLSVPCLWVAASARRRHGAKKARSVLPERAGSVRGGRRGGGPLPCKRPAVPEQSQRQKRQRAGNGEHVQRQRQTARTAGRLIPAPDNGGGRVALHGGAARVCGMVR